MKTGKTRKKRVKGPSTKQRIARLENLILLLEEELPSASIRRTWIIERDIRIYRESIAIERMHLISKIGQVRTYKVSGSYGSNSS